MEMEYKQINHSDMRDKLGKPRYMRLEEKLNKAYSEWSVAGIWPQGNNVEVILQRQKKPEFITTTNNNWNSGRD